jgi:hypothetical protein
VKEELIIFNKSYVFSKVITGHGEFLRQKPLRFNVNLMFISIINLNVCDILLV